MSQLPPGVPFFHPGAPHVRTRQRELPPDVTGLPGVPFTGDFELWLRTGQWETVSSTNVVAIGYDAAQQLIRIRYKNGEQWEYGPFNEDMARRLYLTGSKGIWVWDYIKVRGTKDQHQVPIARRMAA